MGSIGIQERSKSFAVRMIQFVFAMPRSTAGIVLAKQVVRSGTSIGANIEEAQDALSKKDFIHSMQIALKEARETLYWIDLVIATAILDAARCTALRQECEEIVKILRVIVRRSKER